MGQINDLEDALETDHGRGELDGRARETLQRAVELTEIRAERDDGADGERAFDDVPAAEAVDERRAHRADEAKHDEERRADDRAADADVAHADGALAEAVRFLVGAPKQLDEQRAADVEGLVHVRVHLGIVIHGFAGDVAQNVAKPLREEDKQRQDQHADEGQLPFERKHDGQDRNRFDDVGDDADDGVADGVLRADHIVVEARHQLADFGVGEEAQGHPL